jgi:hypothetical protein
MAPGDPVRTTGRIALQSLTEFRMTEPSEDTETENVVLRASAWSSSATDRVR